MDMSTGTPWLDFPLMLEGSREYTCKFENPAYCQYYEYRWRFWYIADWVYALPTVGLFMSVIGLFTLLFAIQQLVPSRVQKTAPIRQVNVIQRFLSSRTYRIPFLNWNSAPLGVLILGLVGFLFFFLMVIVPQPYYWPATDEGLYGDSPALATRSGWLSLACLPFVIATAGKSNLITLFTGVSYERLQVFHRWISYAFFVTALCHTFPFIVFNISEGTMVEAWNGSLFYWTGVVALIAQAYLTFASMSPLRNLSYEWFKFSHFVAAVVFILFLFFHCDYTLTSWDYFVATGVLFSLSWLHRQIKTYFENGIRHRAKLSVTSNGFIKVVVPTTVRWTAGQHFFVRFFGLGIHTLAMHPFSACSLPNITTASRNSESELVFYIQPHSGFTARLLKIAQDNAELGVTLDGPYGGIEMQQLEKSDRILLVAGGSGAGWILPMVDGYLRRLQNSLSAVHEKRGPSLQVVLSSRDRHTAEWFQAAVEALLAEHQMDGRTAGIHVSLHYTGPLSRHMSDTDVDVEKTANAEIRSTGSQESSVSARYSHSDQRADLPACVQRMVGDAHADQSTAVFVCGPLSMQHDVGNSVAEQQLKALRGSAAEVTLHTEHFSWA
ncbi:hypothetical protein AMS68_004347 [Peltaster fructicola]|uniref:ferric-chelate reductase (NADPH) n=1 Tax=Peltaster fructicola TaxID=286661 RepID=A0A6H0XWL8_9PEZI|nr:hypothetical protein AMS68_004347 [Peltaster fructicola]